MRHFQVTADIIINGQKPIEKAFKPALAFLEGNLSTKLINDLYLKLTLDQSETTNIEMSIADPYMETPYHEFVLDYAGLYLKPGDEFLISIEYNELRASLGRAKQQDPKDELVMDSTKILTDVCEAIQNLHQEPLKQ